MQWNWGQQEEFPSFSLQQESPTIKSCPCSCHTDNFGSFFPPNYASASNTRVTVHKSEFDKRDFRYLTLANKLKVLLISDPGTNKAGAALCVQAGSMNDPEDIPGLAHLCEHMICRDSQKYPEENSFGKFLAMNGGDYNAFTQRDSTSYFFDVRTTSLKPALDRFAHLFISPLFSETAVDREVEAITSEHNRNAGNDEERRGLVDNLLCKKGHPYRKFDCGKSETLRDRPAQLGINVVEELRKFYSDHYSANLMTLAVLGRESCTELEGIVKDNFIRIENRDKEISTWPGSPYGPEELVTRIDLV